MQNKQNKKGRKDQENGVELRSGIVIFGTIKPIGLSAIFYGKHVLFG